MLRFLSIQRLAVIDAAEVEFEPGFNVLTGETGAGKSILIEAVGLLLGGRASGDLVRTGEETANIQAIFERGEEELLVRREISASGRSRAFINGTLVTVGALKDLAATLVELHGQHEHQTLLDESTHLAVLDGFGALDDLKTPVAAAYETMRAAVAELAALRRAAADRDSRLDLIAFQLGELDKADPKPAEDDELAATRQVLASAERVERLCTESYTALYENDDSILAGLSLVWKRVAELASIDPKFQPYVESRDGIKGQLEDLAMYLRSYVDGIEASPERLQQVEERLALLERLKRKHGPTLAEVIAKREALSRERDDLQGGDERIAALERAAAAARRSYLEVARRLSVARCGAGERFARELERLVAELAMEQTRFEVRFGDELPESEWTGQGIDRVAFFVSPNPGEELRPLARIVSGGELSRVMLAIKTLTARARFGFSDDAQRPPSAGAPGLVFDEVDAGIGGRVADVVGRRLHGLGSAFQVLCITHLPQISACADVHFVIEKRVDAGRTRTSVRRLDDEGRVEELARMLGGEAVTDGLRASAREMLLERRAARERSAGGRPGQGAKGEPKAKGESERAKAKPRK